MTSSRDFKKSTQHRKIYLGIFLLLLITPVSTQDSGLQNDNLSKSFLSIACLAAAVVIALIVAKLVDYCYDRQTLRDDTSEISEHTRNLIRARLTMAKFRQKKKPPPEPSEEKERTVKALRIWSAKARGRFGKGRFGKGGQTAEDKKDIIIKVDEAVVSEDNSAFTTMPLPTKVDLAPPASSATKPANAKDDDVAASMSGVTLNIVNEKKAKLAENPKDEKQPSSGGKKVAPTSPTKYTKTDVTSRASSPLKTAINKHNIVTKQEAITSFKVPTKMPISSSVRFSGRSSSSLRKSPLKGAISTSINKTEGLKSALRSSPQPPPLAKTPSGPTRQDAIKGTSGGRPNAADNKQNESTSDKNA